MKGGGMERRFIRLFNALWHKHDVSFLTRACLAKDYISLKLTKHHVLSVKDSNRYLELVNFCFIIYKNKPDVVHLIDFGLFNLAISIFSRFFLRKTLLVASLCDYRFIYDRTIRNVLLFSLFMAFVDRVDSLYPSVCKITNNKKVSVSPCSVVDVDKFKPSCIKDKLIYFCGRMEKMKNPLLFVESIVGISVFLRLNGWKVLMVGAGSLENKIISDIKLNRLEDLILFLSESDVSDIATKSYIFVSLQEKENYPSQSLLEAMSSGNAVVATDVGDTYRLVRNNYNGMLVSLCPRAIGHAIKYIIKNDRYIPMGMCGRSIAKRHSALRYSRYLEKIYSLRTVL